MAIVFAITMGYIGFSIVREVLFSFRNSSRIRGLVPRLFINYNLISFHEWELTDSGKVERTQVILKVNTFLIKNKYVVDGKIFTFSYRERKPGSCGLGKREVFS